MAWLLVGPLLGERLLDCVCTHATPPGGRSRVLQQMLLAGSLLGEQLPDHVVVCSLWPQLAERPLWGLLIVPGFPTPVFENSATLRHPHPFCDPGDPETTLSHLGFFLDSPPEHLSGRDVPHRRRL